MPHFFIDTPPLKAARRKLYWELGILLLKKKFFKGLFQAEEQHVKELFRCWRSSFGNSLAPSL